MSVTIEVAYETAVHQVLPVDTVLTGAIVDRILDPRQPRPDREESELLALFLRGHLALLVPEINAVLDAASQQDARLYARVQRSRDEAEYLLAAPPIYTARRTVAVVPLARCCRDLHLHYTAANSLPTQAGL